MGHSLMSTPVNEPRPATLGLSRLSWWSLVVTHPSTNRGRRCLISVNEPLSYIVYSLGRHCKPFDDLILYLRESIVYGGHHRCSVALLPRPEDLKGLMTSGIEIGI
jgi:hypothetical protein